MQRFFLMTVLGKAHDVVGISSDHNYNALLAIKRMKPWVSFEEISRDRAIEILRDGLDGVGVGCFLPMGDDRHMRLSRMGANLKARIFKDICKAYTMESPIVVRPEFVGKPRPKPERPILRLFVFGD